MIIYPKDLKAGIRCCGPEGCGQKRFDVKWVGARHCIGAECAAWEFGTQPRRGYHSFNGEERPEAEPARPPYTPATWEWSEDDCCWYEPLADVEARRHGWCGLIARRSEIGGQ